MIFNPQSTGEAPRLAEELRADLAGRLAKWRILGVAIKAATRGLGAQPSATHYRFTTLKPMPLQLDGEVLALDAGTDVQVDIAPRALATVG